MDEDKRIIWSWYRLMRDVMCNSELNDKTAADFYKTLSKLEDALTSIRECVESISEKERSNVREQRVR